MSRRYTPTESSERIKSHSLTLPCQLSEEDVDQRGRDLALAVKQLADHDARAKEVKKELADERKKLEERTLELKSAVLDKVERRSVPVEDIADFATGVVTSVRQDTYEVVSTRPLQEDERQGVLVAVSSAARRSGPSA